MKSTGIILNILIGIQRTQRLEHPRILSYSISLWESWERKVSNLNFSPMNGKYLPELKQREDTTIEDEFSDLKRYSEVYQQITDCENDSHLENRNAILSNI